MRSLSQRTTTRADSSCERGACVGKRDAPYIFLIHIKPRSQRCGSLLKLRSPPQSRRGCRANGHGGGGWCAVFVGDRSNHQRPRSRSAGVGCSRSKPP